MRKKTKKRLTMVGKAIMFGCIDRAFDDLELMEDWGHTMEEIGADLPKGMMADIAKIRKLSARIHRTMSDYADDAFDIKEMLEDRAREAEAEE